MPPRRSTRSATSIDNSPAKATATPAKKAPAKKTTPKTAARAKKEKTTEKDEPPPKRARLSAKEPPASSESPVDFVDEFEDAFGPRSDDEGDDAEALEEEKMIEEVEAKAGKNGKNGRKAPGAKKPAKEASTKDNAKNGKKNEKKKRENIDVDELSELSGVEDEDEDEDGTEDFEAEDLDSEHLDSEDEYEDADVDAGAKRKSAAKKPAKSPAKKTPTKAKATKKRKKAASSDEEDGEDSEDDLKEGQTIVGTVVKPPKEGWAPPGRISQHTLDFLSKLAIPEFNDREWFRLNESIYRLAEKEWKAFIDAFTPRLIEVDPHIPELPPKDVVHRIYRDIRFSNNKTPYKQGLSASFSRSGRKGVFAHYHISHLLRPRGASRLRRIISSPEFVAYFGAPKPHPKGERQNVFGGEDALKVAPKGIDKNHKDIDLLKLRSVAVIHRFLDSEVVAPDFQESLCKVVKVMQPFVHCLNDMMTLPVEDSDSDNDDEEENAD
ncbi:hypothetical protein M422DRAFT_270162 [Sphaerobolus stellatus SS14]|uniref:Unplaced genomic scaffold SPHSTscaffold_228, whole genome shotgun sequence n=1 Tax=Sphaerobolus stellatus (strain SS14) TaxID=990650 RepID=A0A0C9TGL0_SPHS4|nr:hypothetical protein M422DRAFT_270162 [Sphaerobolus stellatus SS14]